MVLQVVRAITALTMFCISCGTPILENNLYNSNYKTEYYIVNWTQKCTCLIKSQQG